MIQQIYSLDDDSTDTIGLGAKFEGGTVELREYVTGVEVSEHKCLASNEAVELFNGTLSAGVQTITFSEPAHTLTVTSAAIIKSGANYAVLNVTTAGAVVLSGKRYTDTVRTVGHYSDGLLAGQTEKILKVTDATLVTATNSAAVAQRVYGYYQRRIEQAFSKVLGDEVVGQAVNVTTLYGESKTGVIESLDTDLVAGTTKAVIVGVSWFAKFTIVPSVRMGDNGLTAENVVKVRIPAENMPPDALPQNGDYLVRGVLASVASSDDLKPYEHFKVMTVGDNRRGNLKHWAVRGA